MHYRDRVKIISDLLEVLRGSDAAGATITARMRHCNISYLRLERLLTELISAGMVVVVKEESNCGYILTEKGLEFLD